MPQILNIEREQLHQSEFKSWIRQKYIEDKVTNSKKNKVLFQKEKLNPVLSLAQMRIALT